MSNIDFEIKVYDNIIEIIPKDGVKDNSVYNINIDNIKVLNKDINTSIKDLELYTNMTPCYASIFAIKSLTESYEVEDKIVLYHIREASKYVEYIIGGKAEDEIKFKAEQFTKYKAAHECVLRLYIERSSTVGTKGSLGDVTFDNKGSFGDISRLLNHLRKESEKWEEALRGYDFSGKAKPISLVRGIKSNPAMTNLNLRYSRGV